MQFKQIASVLALLLAIPVSVQAASSAAAPKSSTGSIPSAPPSAVRVDKSHWPRGITVASAAIGGVYYVWAVGWQKVLTEKLGIPTNVEVTGGSVQNLILVSEGKSTFGIAGSAHAFHGWNGLEWAKGKKYQNIRLVLPMYSAYVQGMALEKSGIKKLQDLEGKVVGPGPKGSGSDVTARAVLEALQIKPKRIVNAGWEDLNAQMKDGLLDAQLTAAGIPLAAFTELEITGKVVFFGVSKEEAKKVIALHPYYVENVVPPGTYKSVTQPVTTLSTWVMTLANKDLPEDFVYTAVKETYANQAVIASVHASGKEMPMERAAKSPIPVHPGALKYYLEKGVTFPEAAYPPEFKK